MVAELKRGQRLTYGAKGSRAAAVAATRGVGPPGEKQGATAPPQGVGWHLVYRVYLQYLQSCVVALLGCAGV